MRKRGEDSSSVSSFRAPFESYEVHIFDGGVHT